MGVEINPKKWYFPNMIPFRNRRTLASMLIMVSLFSLAGCSGGWESCSSLQARFDELRKSTTLYDENTEGDLVEGSDKWDRAKYEMEKIGEKADEQGCTLYLY